MYIFCNKIKYCWNGCKQREIIVKLFQVYYKNTHFAIYLLYLYTITYKTNINFKLITSFNHPLCFTLYHAETNIHNRILFLCCLCGNLNTFVTFIYTNPFILYYIYVLDWFKIISISKFTHKKEKEKEIRRITLYFFFIEFRTC